METKNIRIEFVVDTGTLSRLDKLRGKRTRSQALRDLIDDAFEAPDVLARVRAALAESERG